jgi:hypothetical protein
MNNFFQNHRRFAILYSIVCTSGSVKTGSILWRIVTLYLLFRKLLLLKPWYHLFLYFYLQTILYLMRIFIPSWNNPDVILHLAITLLLPQRSLGQWNYTFATLFCSLKLQWYILNSCTLLAPFLHLFSVN